MIQYQTGSTFCLYPFNNYEYESYATDAVSIGTFHAVENGILVVAAAGNGGTEEDPPRIGNVAPWILTVGATTIDRFFESDVVLGNNKVIKGGGVHTSTFQKSPVYPLTDGRSAMKPGANEVDASNCYIDALDANKVKGKIVLRRNSLEDTTTSGQYEDIQRLGGIALVYVDNYGQLIDSVSGSIPRIPITWQDREQIQAYMNSTRNPTATILPTITVSNVKPAPSVAFFSGRGPIYKNDYLIKPDVVAPGVDILSAWPSNVTNEAFNILSGTSMSCPHVTGIAALIKSKYPSWGPTEIKSALMTTANPANNLKKPITNNVGDPVTPYEMGAGEVTLFSPSQPGLVYKTKGVEYLRFLCYKGYNTSTIKLLSSMFPANFSCPKNSNEEMISNINYPSIVIVQSANRKFTTVTRTVTNVGDEESTYRVTVEMSQNVEIKVSPTELKFTKYQKKLSYEVTTYAAQLNGFAYGSISWSNEKHNVRIPFVVTN
ncbi:OLC1v1005865C1 [Oldenlandia corymbosa var. corymbosa]|uniref:OLC1v1005865C1 n=1 Tax=Oldenlandia corymbosa var. corymbosa TaxID=529605 RepID=A0AAV1DJ12_OLDCO|nr:OLC1v1005865C1 [Oldenlandia corymbosa var. corymbosa]